MWGTFGATEVVKLLFQLHRNWVVAQTLATDLVLREFLGIFERTVEEKEFHAVDHWSPVVASPCRNQVRRACGVRERGIGVDEVCLCVIDRFYYRGIEVEHGFRYDRVPIRGRRKGPVEWLKTKPDVGSNHQREDCDK